MKDSFETHSLYNTVLVLFVLVAIAIGSGPVNAQERTAISAPERQNTLGVSASSALAPVRDQKVRFYCTLSRPMQVRRYGVRCDGATYLDVSVADCCISGDHWEAKAKAWDTHPNTAVTTSPGPRDDFSVAARVYNYGGTPENPDELTAEVDCSYIHGVNVFPASSTFVAVSDGLCTVTELGARDAINRTP